MAELSQAARELLDTIRADSGVEHGFQLSFLFDHHPTREELQAYSSALGELVAAGYVDLECSGPIEHNDEVISAFLTEVSGFRPRWVFRGQAVNRMNPVQTLYVSLAQPAKPEWPPVHTVFVSGMIFRAERVVRAFDRVHGETLTIHPVDGGRFDFFISEEVLAL